MLAKLAFGNIRRSARDYSIYFVTLVLGVAVFYAFNSIAVQADFLDKSAAEGVRNMEAFITGLTVFIAVIMGFLMVYANNFLMRRRKQELGLYQVLGMKRSQVSFIITFETFIVALISSVVGILVGMLLSQLLLFVTAALFRTKVTHFHFFFSTSALLITLVSFALIFVMMALLNLYSLRKLKLIELISARHQQEHIVIKSVSLSAAFFVLGCGLVGIAYYRLLTWGFPGFNSGANPLQFVVTTVMVIVGTVLAFFGLATVATSLLRRSKHYWRDLNAFTMRQVDSQINSACMSMAVVSLVLFLAITSVTGGMSICSALNEMARASSPFSASIKVVYGPDTTKALDIQQIVADEGVDLASVGTSSLSTLYRTDKIVSKHTSVHLSDIGDKLGIELPDAFKNASGNILGMFAMSLSDYNSTREILGMPKIQLADDEYAISCTLSGIEQFYKAMLRKGYDLEVGGRKLHASTLGLIDDPSAAIENSLIAMNPGTLILPDDVLEAGTPYETVLNLAYIKPVAQANVSVQKAIDILKQFQADKGETNHVIQVMSLTATEAAQNGNTLSGLISYLAIYIGFVLVVSCATILAIQQLSSSADSAPRYCTLAELGCPDKLLRRSLATQIAVSFILPLIVALAHSLCALVVVIKLIESFGFVNLVSSSTLVLVIFVVVYGGYLLITYACSRGLMLAAITEGRHAL